MKTRPKTIDEMYADINNLKDKVHDRFLKLQKEMTDNFEKTKNAVDERAQYVQDVVEGFGRQQHPGTKLCPQCYGAGGKWLVGEGEIDTKIIIFSGLRTKEWWTCDTCKGTGRIPAEKKKG